LVAFGLLWRSLLNVDTLGRSRTPPMGDEKMDHPILPRAWEYRIVGLRLELNPIETDEPYLDLTLRKGEEVCRLRFWSPVDLEVERGGPSMTWGLVIRDARTRGMEGIGVQVDDFEGSNGAVRFAARDVELCDSYRDAG
jgi:hypothetical protein